MRRLILACLLLCFSAATSFAQGLVWSLPADGTWVLFEGEYQQTDIGGKAVSETMKEDVVTTWKRQLTIKSVGVEQAEYNGQQTACRWLEFVLIDGKPDQDGKPVPGPGGKIVYKVLVPEVAVIGKSHDENGIFNEYLPIVKGYREVSQIAQQTLDSGVLQVYPTLTLLMPYREYTSAGMEKPESSLVESAEKLTATLSIESRGVRVQDAGEAPSVPYSTRVTSDATLWRSDAVPFGLVGWEVKQARSRKPNIAPRSEFTEISRIIVTMTARDQGTDAQSELVPQN